MAEKKVNPRVVWTVSILLAFLFTVNGVLLIVRPPQVGSPLAGSTQPLHPLVLALGVAFCLGSVLLLVPRTAWIGASLLAVLLVGVIGVWLVQGAVIPTVMPALLVISLGSLAYIRRPGGAYSSGEGSVTTPTAGVVQGQSRG
jgi:hypothetical protein